MLAKRVTVNLFGQISDTLYSGYITGENNENIKAFVISSKTLNQSGVGGQVIATLNL